MPNWCANSLKIKPLTEEAKKTFSKIKAELEKGQECRLFNTIIPMPNELMGTVCGSVEEDKRAAHEAQMQANIEKYGYPTWYEFANNKWGTKWDVSEPQYMKNKDGSVTIWFDTAWSPPIAFYNFLFDEGWDVTAKYYEPGVGFIGEYDNSIDDCWEYSYDDEETIKAIPEELLEWSGLLEDYNNWKEDNEEIDDAE